MNKQRRTQFVEELEARCPELKGNLTSLTFRICGTWADTETTRIKIGRGIWNKFFGRTLVKVGYTHCDMVTPSEGVRIYDESRTGQILDAYEASSPEVKALTDHGPRGKSRWERGLYHFGYNPEKYLKALLKAGNSLLN